MTSLITALDDIRYAARLLRRSPLFTVTSVLSVAIGLAGIAAVFSLADAVLFRSRPGIADAARLVDVGRTTNGDGFDTFSYPDAADYAQRNTVFADFAVYKEGTPFGLAVDDERAARVFGGQVSANYFRVLGVPIVLGRGFDAADDRPGAAATVIISDALWRSQFDGAVTAVGRRVRVNGRPATIIGVTAPLFAGHGVAREMLWVPVAAQPENAARLGTRGSVWLLGIAKLKPGVTVAQARADVERIGLGLQREFPDTNRGRGAAVGPLKAVPQVIVPVVGGFVALLFALVALILAIACTNVGAMLLARGMQRARETSVRLAVGAGRAQIIRLALAESMLIAAGGAALGLAGARVAIDGLQQLLPVFRTDVALELRLDWRVFAVCAAAAIAAGGFCGVVPALHTLRAALAAAVRRDVEERRTQRARRVFVAAQVAMSVLLVVCALLLSRSMTRALQIDPGFSVANVDAVGVDLQLAGYDAASGAAFLQRLSDRLATLPGVDAAASASVVPLTLSGSSYGRVWRPDQTGNEAAISPDWSLVTPRYFETMRMTLTGGRMFTDADRAGAKDVAVVNETLARRAWPGDNAVGKTLVVGARRRPIEIVGVVRDAKYRSIGEAPRPFVYAPASQIYDGEVWIFARTQGASAIPALRRLLREMDPALPIVREAPLVEMTAFTLLPQRLAAWVSGIVAAIGLVLAALGIYGITAYDVTRRTREIGVRMALGALRGTVVRMIVRQAMSIAAIGGGVGLVAAALATRALGALLYGVAPLDPVSFAGGIVILAAIAMLASAIPARRAATVNPLEALRQD